MKFLKGTHLSRLNHTRINIAVEKENIGSDMKKCPTSKL